MNIKDDERVFVDYAKIIGMCKKRHLSLSSVSKAADRSPGFISAMASGNSEMLYGDLKKIARALGVHGATKLMATVSEERVDMDIIEEIRADMPADQRIAEALEKIAAQLDEIIAKKKR